MFHLLIIYFVKIILKIPAFSFCNFFFVCLSVNMSFIVAYKDTIFWATMNHDYISPVPAAIIFGWAQITPGGYYDNTTGIFTAPVNGLYEFNVQLRSTDDTFWGFTLFANGDDRAYTQGRNNLNGASGSSTVIFELLAKWTVSVRPTEIESLDRFSSMAKSWFSGKLISAN